ncbi:MAG: hypothetical protein P8Q14_04625 [Vicingaceae bacterium]|nr:hypothetical protein [Vicingaceae bacterium]
MNKEENKNSIDYIKKYWPISILLIGLIMFSITSIESDKTNKKMKAEYPYIQTEDSLNGQITKIIKQKRGNELKVELKSGVKKSIGWATNEIYNPKELTDFVMINDSIFKPSYSDDFFVYRNGNRYDFLLFNYLNE